MNDRKYKPADRSKADTKKESEQIEDVNQDPAEEYAPRIADQPRGSGSGSGSGSQARHNSDRRFRFYSHILLWLEAGEPFELDYSDDEDSEDDDEGGATSTGA
ncbi:hypothetical protein SLS60_006569 [Paraconiothyrium brasiliense]|uniref:Uncharacterized protein n=1 Tax=Paraconiothyrium brasiliense TaxID=300254 RepID=A0ABR3RB60_9PLEO